MPFRDDALRGSPVFPGCHGVATRLSRCGIMIIPGGNVASGSGIANKVQRVGYPILGVSTRAKYRNFSRGRRSMTARIFKPAKNAMQSGRASTKEWRLEYEPEQPRGIEPLMGWTSSGDMKQQLTLHFDSKEEATAYCERKGIPYQVIEPKQSALRQVAYADNFAFRRGEPWTH